MGKLEFAILLYTETLWKDSLEHPPGPHGVPRIYFENHQSISTPLIPQPLSPRFPSLEPLCNGQMQGPILQRASGFLNRRWIESVFVGKLYIPFHH